MATYNDIILRAMRLLKVKESGESLQDAEGPDGLQVMTDLIESWSNERWMQTHITEITHTLTAGDGVYTVGNAGSSGDIQLPQTLYCGRLDLSDQDYTSWTGITSGQFKINIGASTTLRTGNITTASGSAAVTGAGTKFTSELSIGDVLTWIDDSTVTKTGTVLSITDATNLTLTANSDSVSTGVAYSTNGTENIIVDLSSSTSLTNIASSIQQAIRKRNSQFGTITTAESSDAVVGTNTVFNLVLSAGDVIEWIDDAGVTKYGTVLTVTDATNIVLSSDADSVATGVAYSIYESVTNFTFSATEQRFEITRNALPSKSISYLTAGAAGTDISSKMKGLSTQATKSVDSDFWPVKIQSAFIRDANNFDTPIYPMTDEQYGRIGIKSTQSNYPQAYYYKREYPIGKIYLYDVPSSAVSLHLRVWPQWAAPKSGTQTVSFPPGYKRAIEYNLAVELSPEYVDQIDPLIMQKATDSKAYIKRVNSVPPVMKSDARYIGRHSNRFDINSGSYR